MNNQISNHGITNNQPSNNEKMNNDIINNEKMNNDEIETFEFLHQIQEELDHQYEIFTKKDFDCKILHHNSIKSLLIKRNQFISNHPYLSIHYWSKAFLNYQIGIEILPVDNNHDINHDNNHNINADWIKSLEVDYIEGYICRVHIELNENDFVCNEYLTKIINLEKKEIETTKVEWKSIEKHIIFNFFDSETEDFEIFDILYELYVNSSFYFLLSN